MPRPRLMIVVASTRPGRVGLPVAQWFRGRVEADGRFEVVFADLAEIDLPFVDEPNHPRLHEYTKEHTKRWSALVDSVDAFAFVHPEYNHGLNAPLVNALDYLYGEWAHKPAGLVSYGGISAGTRAAQTLKQFAVALSMVPVAKAVSIPFVAKIIDDEGRVEPSERMEAAADAMLTELIRVEAALRPLRAEPAG